MIKVSYKQKSADCKVEICGDYRFPEDCITYDSETYSIWSVGCFLNKEECINNYGCKSLSELLETLLVQQKCVSQVLNGVYIVVIYDKGAKRLLIYNDLLSKQSVFFSYHEEKGYLLLSDNFFEVITMLSERELPYSTDSLGIKMMLKHRMFYHDLTYVNEIKFLRPFEYIEVNDISLSVKEIKREGYINTTGKEAVDTIHQLFSKAVKLQYLKNEINGFPQVATLSGGMDSRSTFLYSLSQGYAIQTCYCYAESTSADYDIARQLAIRNRCEFFFHPIDNGGFLYNRDMLCEANEGQMVYSGPTGTYDTLHFLDTSKFGVIHTGLGGGEIMGDMRIVKAAGWLDRQIDILKYHLGKGKKDNTWESFMQSLDCNKEEKNRLGQIRTKYRDFDDFQSLNDIRRCLNSQKVAMTFGVYYISPFLYEDFFCYMLRIPTSLTKDRQLYLSWQKKYNPEQFSFPSTFQMGCSPNNKWGYYAKRFNKYVVNKFGGKTKYDMTPYEYWLSKDPEISKYMEKTFREDIKATNGKLDIELQRYIESEWNKNELSHPNILTASWAIRKIIAISKH